MRPAIPASLVSLFAPAIAPAIAPAFAPAIAPARAPAVSILGILRIGAVTALVVLIAACRGGAADAAPPCGAVAARFLDIARHELATARVDEATSRAVSDQLPAMRDAFAGACSDGKWSEAIRRCLVRANDHGELEACEQQLTDEERRDLDRATRGNPETP